MARSDAVAAVTGELFEDGWSKIRGGRGASQARRQQQISRAASGHSPAVFKPVRAGGCRTRAQLVGQLTYLTTKSSHIIDSRSVYDGYQRLNAEQISDIADRFSGAWNEKFSPKLGNTTHMIMAFPIGTKGEDVRDIAAEVCERFFMQEGRQFDYIVAIHEDRAHPHAHVVINRRSVEGELFYLGQDHHFNYDDFRLAMVEAAEKRGVRLEATRRLDRGVHSYSPTKREVYRAKEEGREPAERQRAGANLDRALGEIAKTTALYRSLAGEATTENRAQVADALKRAVALLERGGQIKPDGEIYMSETANFDELRGAFSDQAIRAEQVVAQADPARRAALERELNEIYADVAHMQPLGPRSDSLREPPTETGVYAEANINSNAIDRLSQPETRAKLEAALDGTGISADQVVSRLETGANNAALERQWMTDDLQRIAETDGLDLERQDHLETALARLDDTHVRLGETLHEAEILRDSGVREEDAELIEDGDRVGVSASVIEAMRRDSAADPFVSEADRVAFRAEIEERLDDRQLEDLRAGDESVLSEVAANRLDRLYTAKAYLQSDAATANSAATNEVMREIASEEVDAARERHAETDGEKGTTHG